MNQTKKVFFFWVSLEQESQLWKTHFCHQTVRREMLWILTRATHYSELNCSIFRAVELKAGWALGCTAWPIVCKGRHGTDWWHLPVTCVCPPSSQAALKMVTFKVQISLLCLGHWKPQKGGAGSAGCHHMKVNEDMNGKLSSSLQPQQSVLMGLQLWISVSFQSRWSFA